MVKKVKRKVNGRMPGVDSDKETRIKILDSAKHIFSQKGYSGARLVEVAEGAGCNKALIHYYFKNKENLYTEVLRRIIGSSREGDVPIYSGSWTLTPPQKLYVLIYFVVHMFLNASDIETLRLIFWELAEGRRVLENLVMEYSLMRQKVMVEVIEEGIRKGSFETGYPELAAMNLISFISFYLIHRELYGNTRIFQNLYGDTREEDIFSYILEFCFKSLQPGSGEIIIPEIPDDLKVLLDNLIDLLIDRKNEGINEAVYQKIEEIVGIRA